MKSKLNNAALLLLILFSISCKEKINTEQKLVTRYFNEMNIPEKQREGNFILFPSTGCFGCTEKTVNWIMENRETTKNYKLIFGKRKENDIYIDSLQNIFLIFYDADNKMGVYEFGYGYPFFISFDKSKNTKVIPFKSYSPTPFGF